MFVGTNAVIDEEHIDSVFVTTNEYVPPVLTVIVGVLVELVIPAPLQLYVMFDVVDVTTACAVLVVQVIEFDIAGDDKLGNPALGTTVTACEEVQPFAGFVTVRV